MLPLPNPVLQQNEGQFRLKNITIKYIPYGKMFARPLSNSVHAHFWGNFYEKQISLWQMGYLGSVVPPELSNTTLTRSFMSTLLFFMARFYLWLVTFDL